MVLALEPKKGIENVGMVGIENTFIVTGQGQLFHFFFNISSFSTT